MTRLALALACLAPIGCTATIEPPAAELEPPAATPLTIEPGACHVRLMRNGDCQVSCVARASAPAGTRLELFANGRPIAGHTVASAWQERHTISGVTKLGANEHAVEVVVRLGAASVTLSPALCHEDQAVAVPGNPPPGG